MGYRSSKTQSTNPLTSSPHRLKRRIQIQIIAVIQKISAQRGDVHVGADAHGHDHGEHGCAGVRCGVGAGLQLFDVDALAREEGGQLVHDAGLVERGEFDAVGGRLQFVFLLTGAFAVDGEADLVGEGGQLRLQF